MNAQQIVVPDVLWQRLEPHLQGKVSDAGGSAKGFRLFLETVFWRIRTGSLWRDLQRAFGNRTSQFRRFRRGAKNGVFESLFRAMSDDPDLECALVGGKFFSGAPKGHGGKSGFQAQAIGRSRGGLTTNIVALVEALGNPVCFLRLPG